YARACPTVINRLDLKSACDNPIKTRWRITTNYAVSERTVNVICQGQENCEITTIYTIKSDAIVFKIVNSTNDIFYSRVMKSGNRNYICIDDCGKIDPHTNIISKRQQPYHVDLFKKNKRENVLSMAPVLPINKKKCAKNEDFMTVEKYKHLESIEKMDGFMDFEKNTVKPYKNEPKLFSNKIKNSSTKSACKRLQDYAEQNYKDNSFIHSSSAIMYPLLDKGLF
ncbi:uncharacterized protein LOC112046152, partial [Bicyclus anynana]|uniref:Uncharacterized protein LOC112046152 n=1 Tax=Bicyclus anynana TaxID=110368 RepID=A0A6J1N042_BICAN